MQKSSCERVHQFEWLLKLLIEEERPLRPE
jgi:hypothetical protein